MNNTKPKIAIILEGGIVQSVVSDCPECCSVIIIDYDVTGPPAVEVQQHDGEPVRALVYNGHPQASLIPLDTLFSQALGGTK